MADTAARLPPIPDIASLGPGVSPQLRNMLGALATTLKLYTGRLPNQHQDDQLVTFKDLGGIKAAKVLISNPLVSENLGGSGGGSTVIIQNPSEPESQDDLTPPPALSNVVVVSTQTGLIATLDQPTYWRNGTTVSNHAHTMLYMADAVGGVSPGFAAAKATAQTSGSVLYVPIGNGRDVFVWLRNVSRADVDGPLYGGAAGVRVETPLAIDAILDLLTDALTTDQLAQDLNSRIDLIDGPASLPGSVAARVQSEATARELADSAMSQSVATVAASIRGGENLLFNAAFEADIAGWEVSWKQNAGDPDPVFARNLAGDDLRPTGMNNIGLHRAGTPTGVQDATTHSARFVPAEPGARYCLSAWLANHRAHSQILIAFISPDWSQYHEVPAPAVTAIYAGGQDLAGWQRAFVFATVPTWARWAFVRFRQWPTGESDPYSWACRPMLERASAAQTAPSPWSPGAVGMQAAITEVKSQASATAATVSASHTIKVQAQANGTTAIAGIGLMAEAGTGSEVAILADKFKVVGAGLSAAPFTIYTSAQVESGVTIPAGIYMDAAHIRNLNALIARIGNAAIDQAKIGQLDVAKLNVNSMTANFAQAVTGQFQDLSAMRIWTGDLNVNRLDIQYNTAANDWGWARSAGKFFGDGLNGWIMARRPDGRTLFEAKGGSSRIWMSSWGDCGISFPKFSVDNAGNANFGGTLTADRIVSRQHIVEESATLVRSAFSASGFIELFVFIPTFCNVCVTSSVSIPNTGRWQVLSRNDGSGWITLRTESVVGGSIPMIAWSGGIGPGWFGFRLDSGDELGRSAYMQIIAYMR